MISADMVPHYIAVRERIQFERLIIGLEVLLREQPFPAVRARRHVEIIESFGEEWHDLTTRARRLLKVTTNRAHSEEMRHTAEADAIIAIRDIVDTGRRKLDA